MCTDIEAVADKSVTRLSRLHPYPAMVADPLAVELVDRYVRPGDSVLDPFCGSGRLLASATRVPGRRVGVDTNPLACLVTQAKLTAVDVALLESLLGELEHARVSFSGASATILLRHQRKVAWFPGRALAELAEIIKWLNTARLDPGGRLLAAAAFSASVRDVSFARKDGWKLHRLGATARAAFDPSAWDCFKRNSRTVLQRLAGVYLRIWTTATWHSAMRERFLRDSRRSATRHTSMWC